MKDILQEISETSILLGDIEFTDEQIKSKWLGFNPADPLEIEKVEMRLGVKLPQDYKDFLNISNGFPRYDNAVTASFIPVEKIDYLKVLDPFIVETWQEYEELKDVAKCLESSILIGGLDEEQYFLLIPPHVNSGEWGYWKFASWIPGEEKYNSLKDYLSKELSFLKEGLK